MVTREYFRSICKAAFDAIDEALVCDFAMAVYGGEGTKFRHVDGINPDTVRDELSRRYAELVHLRIVNAYKASNKMEKVCMLAENEMSKVLHESVVRFDSTNTEGVIGDVSIVPLYGFFPGEEDFLDKAELGIEIIFSFFSDSSEACSMNVSYARAGGCSVLFADLLYDLCDRRNWVPNAGGALEYVHPTEKDYVLPVKKVE